MGNNTNRRGWIKNIAIIFLSFLLILTLFSNTILNRSLPEVSAQYAMYDSISTAVKLSGTVKAKESHPVIYEEEAAENDLSQTRTVVSVYVKVGEMVEKDTPLLALKGGASKELAAAEKELAEKQAAYDLDLLKDKADALESGTVVTRAQQALDDLKDELADLRATYDKLSAAGDGSEALDEQMKAYEAQKKELTKKKEAVDGKITELEGKISALAAQLEFDLSDRSHADRLNEADDAFAQIELTYLRLKNDTEAAKAAWDELKDASAGITEWATIYDTIQSLEEQIAALRKTDSRAREDYVESLKQAARTVGAFSSGDSLSEEDSRITAVAGAVSAYIQTLDTDVFETIEKTVHLRYDWETVLFEIENVLTDALERIGVDVTDGAVQGEIAAYISAIESPARAHRRSMEDSAEAMAKLYLQIDEERGKLQVLGVDINGIDSLTDDYVAKALANAEKAYNDLNEDFTAAETEYTKAKTEVTTLRTLVDYETKLAEYESESAGFEKELTHIDEILAPLGENGSIDAFLKEIEQKEREVSSAEVELQKAQVSGNVSDVSTKQEREKQHRDIEELKAKIEAYKTAPEHTDIVAPIAGRVVALDYVPGNTVTSGNTVARIEVAEKGYLCEITVPSEEARKIQVGAECSITNSWWSDLTATVSQVRSDPQSQGKNRIVVIELMGDVNEGQTLNFTVGDRSQSYSTVLPNSAIREDSGGKFVLVVESKSTPLGVRYTATRYTINVVASDDTKSAVSGLMGGEFVITNASSPVSDGQQVRLAET